MLLKKPTFVKLLGLPLEFHSNKILRVMWDNMGRIIDSLTKTWIMGL